MNKYNDNTYTTGL